MWTSFVGATFLLTVYQCQGVAEGFTCRSTTLGKEYTGTVSTTKGNYTCDRWDSTKRDGKDDIPTNDPANFPDEKLADASNYCRNPDNEPDGPWCFTTNPSEKQWQYCDIKYCPRGVDADSTSVPTGGVISIGCIGSKHADLGWHHNDMPINTTGPRIWLNESSSTEGVSVRVQIKIEDVIASDAGRYSCRSGNDIDDQASVDITVTGGRSDNIPSRPPSITMGPPKHLLFKTGQQIELTCEGNGHPTPRFEWYVNDVLLDLLDHVNIRKNESKPGSGSIIIDPANSEDGGYYQCRAENKHGTALSQVVFLEEAFLDTEPAGSTEKYRATQGASLKLNCQPRKSVPPPELSWATSEERDSTDTQNIVTSRRIHTDEDGNLYFSYLTKEDGQSTGVYRCNTKNTFLNKTAAGSFAKISTSKQTSNRPTDVKPSIMHRTGRGATVVGLRGEVLRLQCVFAGKPDVIIEWSRGTSYSLPAHHTVQAFGSELVITNVQLSDSATYKCTGINTMGNASQEIRVTVEAAPIFEKAVDGPRNRNVTEGDTVEVPCRADAIPPASVAWLINGRLFEDAQPGSRYQLKANDTILTISNVCKHCDNGTSDLQNIQCNASNYHGYNFSSGYINVLPEHDDGWLVILVSGVLVGLAALAIFVACCWRSRRKRRLRKQSQPLLPPDMSHFVIMKESELNKGDIIGSGCFGTVYKGIWMPEGHCAKIPVAIKVLKEDTSSALSKELLNEARVMASVSNPNCIRLLAVCMTAQVMLVTQLMPLGCLLNYVRKHKANMSSKTMLLWCSQIAEGMNYLEGRGIVHRDLAARNVLVETREQVKITDFGLAKLLDYKEDSIQDIGGKIPLKWVAFECMKNGIFTHRSDVWSYGVTIWEIFTYGQMPFAGVDMRNMQEFLETGQRLPQPDICSIDIFLILMKCWMIDPFARPSFKELAEEFTRMCTDPCRYLVTEDDKLRRLPSQACDVTDLVHSINFPNDGDEEAYEEIVDDEDNYHDYCYPSLPSVHTTKTELKKLGVNNEYVNEDEMFKTAERENTPTPAPPGNLRPASGFPSVEETKAQLRKLGVDHEYSNKREMLKTERDDMGVPQILAPAAPAKLGNTYIPMKHMAKSKPLPVDDGCYLEPECSTGEYIDDVSD